jgi:hypothetical protein
VVGVVGKREAGGSQLGQSPGALPLGSAFLLLGSEKLHQSNHKAIHTLACPSTVINFGPGEPLLLVWRMPC